MKKKVMLLLLSALLAKAPPKFQTWDEASRPVLAENFFEVQGPDNFFYMHFPGMKVSYGTVFLTCAAYDTKNGTNLASLFLSTFEEELTSKFSYPRRRHVPLPVYVPAAAADPAALQKELTEKNDVITRLEGEKSIANGEFEAVIEEIQALLSQIQNPQRQVQAIPAVPVTNNPNIVQLVLGIQTSIQDLDKLVQSKTQENEGFKQQLQGLAGLQQQLTILQTEKADLERQITTLGQQPATVAVDLQKQIDALKAEKLAMEQKIADLELQVKDVTNLQVEKVGFEQKIVNLEAQVKAATDLQKQLDDLQAEKVAVEKKVATLEQDVKTAAGVQQTLADLQIKKVEADKEIVDLKQRIVTLEQQSRTAATGFQKKVDALQREKADIEGKVADLELQAKTLVELQKQRDSLQREKAGFEQKIADLEGQLNAAADLQKRLDTLQAEKTAADKKVEAEHLNAVAGFEAEKVGLVRQIATLGQQVTKAAEDFQKQISALQVEKAADLKKQGDAFQTEKADLEQRIAVLEQEASAVAGLRQTLADLRVKKTEVEGKVATLEQEIKAAAGLQQQLTDLQVEKAKIERSVATLEQQAKDAAELQRKIEEENKALQQRLGAFDTLCGNLDFKNIPNCTSRESSFVLSELVKRFNELINENAQLHSTSSALKSDAELLRSRSERFQTQKNASPGASPNGKKSPDAEKVAAEREQFRLENLQLTTDLGQLRTENSQLTTTLDQLRTNLSADLDKSRTENSNLTTEFGKLRAEYTNLTAELAQVRTADSALIAELNKLRAENAELAKPRIEKAQISFIELVSSLSGKTCKDFSDALQIFDLCPYFSGYRSDEDDEDQMIRYHDSFIVDFAEKYNFSFMYPKDYEDNNKIRLCFAVNNLKSLFDSVEVFQSIKNEFLISEISKLIENCKSVDGFYAKIQNLKADECKEIFYKISCETCKDRSFLCNFSRFLLIVALLDKEFESKMKSIDFKGSVIMQVTNRKKIGDEELLKFVQNLVGKKEEK